MILAGVLGSVATLLLVALVITVIVIRMCIKQQREGALYHPEDERGLHRNNHTEINNNLLFQMPNNFQSAYSSNQHTFPSFITSSFRGRRHPNNRDPPPPYQAHHRSSSDAAMFDFPTPMSHFSQTRHIQDNEGSSLSSHGARGRGRHKQRQKYRRDSEDTFDASSLGGYVPKRTDVPPLRPSRNIYDETTEEFPYRRQTPTETRYNDQTQEGLPYRRETSTHNRYNEPTAEVLQYRRQPRAETRYNNDLNRQYLRQSSAETGYNDGSRQFGTGVNDNSIINRLLQTPGTRTNIVQNTQDEVRGDPQDTWTFTNPIMVPADNAFSYPPGPNRHRSDRSRLGELFIEPDHRPSTSQNVTHRQEDYQIMYQGADGDIHRTSISHQDQRLRLHRTVSHDSDQRMNGATNEGYDDDALTPYYLAEPAEVSQTLVV